MKKIMPLIITILLLIVLSNFIPQTTSVIISPGTYFEADNENYTVAHPMNFSQVLVNSSWVSFNNTGL